MSTVAKKIAFHTLGCKLNFSETSSLSRDSLKYGYENVNSKDFADIYVFNTCSVTENANKETRKLIRRSKRINPNAFITLIGCYAQLKPEELIDIKDVNLVLGTADKFDLLSHLDKIDTSVDIKSSIGGNINDIKIFNPSFSNDDRTRSFLKVQDGCDYNCTFCTIPKARGPSRNQTVQQTMKVAEKLAETSAKEVVLTGVNIGDFGSGSDESFIDLIKFPICTEKTIRLLQQNQYSFAVDPKAKKSTIKQAVEQLFDVDVTSVNTSLQPIRKKRVGKFLGRKARYKRAIVTLAPDNSITLFEDS